MPSVEAIVVTPPVGDRDAAMLRTRDDRLRHQHQPGQRLLHRLRILQRQRRLSHRRREIGVPTSRHASRVHFTSQIHAHHEERAERGCPALVLKRLLRPQA